MTSYKFIFGFLVFLLLSSTISANISRERRVYYLDQSGSMSQNKLSQKVCDSLINAINKVNNENSELYVIPFAYNKEENAVLHPLCGGVLATSVGKQTLINAIKNIQWSKNTMTYHKDPIEDFYNNHRAIDDGVTYMFLMTDGEDEWYKVEPSEKFRFHDDLKQWSEHYKGQKVYGFYVMLHESAQNSMIENIVKDEPYFWTVKSPSVDINILRPISTSVFNFRSADSLFVDMEFEGNLNGLPLVITGTNLLSVKGLKRINDSVLRIFLEPTTTDYSTVPPSSQAKFHIELKGADSEGVLLSKDVYNVLVETDFFVDCVCQPGTNISLGVEKQSNWTSIQNIIPINFSGWIDGRKSNSLGVVKHYNGSILVKSDSTIAVTNTFRFTIDDYSLKFNPYAEFHFVIDDKLDAGDIKVLSNGTDVSQKSLFVDKPQDLNLTFWLSPTVPDGDYKVELVLDNHNLMYFDNISIPSSNVVKKWSITQKKILSPPFIWFWRILLLIILLYIFLKTIFSVIASSAPKFHPKYQIDFLAKDDFDTNKEHNFQMVTDDCSDDLVIDGGNIIRICNLHNQFIKEIDVIREDASPKKHCLLERKLFGRTIYIHCKFHNDNINKIVFKPRKGMKIECEINNTQIETLVIKDYQIDTDPIEINGCPIKILARRPRT